MSNIDNGGPAFPFPSDCDAGEPGELGMTLRDYFAAKAMQALIAGESVGEWDDKNCANGAYKLADAMLAARKGGAA